MGPEFRNLLNKFKKGRIAVWGDLILDEYVFTSAGRVSREAPVLITEWQKSDFRMGGAGNVLMNLRALGANPVPMGFIGNDEGGGILKSILVENRIDTSFLVEPAGYTTPRKSRIMSGSSNTRKQQVLRIDRLNKGPVDAASYSCLQEKLESALKECDLLVISDYLFVSAQPQILENIRTLYPDLTVVVDSRKHFFSFRHISVATPNEPELRKLFPNRKLENQADFIEAGRELMKSVDARGVLLKRGHLGMVVVSRDAPPHKLGIYGSEQIVDVTGAGDTVISVFALGLFAGLDICDAARLANVAAGLSVMKMGACPVKPSELEKALAESEAE